MTLSNFNKVAILSIPFIALVLLAGLRPVGLDQDSPQYYSELLFNFSDIDLISKEPTYWILLITNLTLFNGSPASFFLMYAFLGVLIKFLAISKISPYPALSIVVYVSFFYILHEMTQIRAGVAIGLVFWSIIDVAKNNKKNFLIKILIATLFHYSAIVFIMLYFIGTKFRKTELALYFFLPILGIIFMYTNLFKPIIYSLPEYLPSFLGYKIDLYFMLLEKEKLKTVNPINLGNISLLIALYFAMFMIFKNNTKSINNDVLVLSVKWLSLGFFILFSLSFIEVFAYRMANYLFFSLVIVLPFVFTRFRPRAFSLSVFAIFLAYIFYSSLQMLNFDKL